MNHDFTPLSHSHLYKFTTVDLVWNWMVGIHDITEKKSYYHAQFYDEDPMYHSFSGYRIEYITNFGVSMISLSFWFS